MTRSDGNIWLSIILPCYNIERYLDDCLRSLIDQIDTDHKDIEIICVNDGSTDNTRDKLEKYSRDYKNIHIISTENRGVSAARNIGIERSVGDYVTFVDPDDAIPENLICNIREIISSNNCVDIVFGCLKSFPDDDFYKRSDFNIDYSDYEVIEGSAELRNTGVRDFSNNVLQGAPVAQFISRKLLMENGIRFRENLAIGEDEVFSFEIKAVCKKAIFVRSIFYFYRLRQGSAMRPSGCDFAKKRQNSNKNKALIYLEKCDIDPLAIPPYIAAVNQSCFMLLFIDDVKYIRKAKKELSDLGFYPPLHISDSCMQTRPKSIKLLILDTMKRMLKYPWMFWILWFAYGFRRR